MKFHVVFSCLCLAAAPVSAQTFLDMPATANPGGELGNYTLIPFMQPNARVQFFYDAAEVGAPVLVADQLLLRYDGPVPQVGAPGPFTIQRLEIRIGATAIPAPGAAFAANLTQPLTTVFDGPWTWLPDNGSASPHPWGGPNDTLTFPFTAPAPVVIGSGEWLVVEIVMTGNNIAQFGFAHALLDGAPTTGGLSNGSAASFGGGCAITTGAPAATANATGLFGPGGAHFLGGQHLGASTVAIGVFGFSNTTAGGAPLPITLPGTTCSLLVSPDLLVPVLTDAAGTVAGAAAIALPVPPNPAFSGFALYEQMVALAPAANAFGLAFSDAVTVSLGSWAPPGRGTWMVAHDTDAVAAFANTIRAFGLAMRLRTL